MTQVTKDQCYWDGDTLTHDPTGASIKRNTDFINYGRAGEVLEDGRHFDRNDVGAMLLRLMEEKKWR